MAARSAPRPARRGLERRNEILEAATEVFLERGFAGASTDAIVERSGGSKETIYCHFGNKAGLFRAVIEKNASRVFADLAAPRFDIAPATFLAGFGRDFVDLVLHPRSLRLHSMVIAESQRMPEVGDIFYRAAPEALIETLADYFRRCDALGLLRVPEPLRMARAFLDMLRGDLQLRTLLNATRRPTDAEIDAHVAFVVAAVLRLCERPEKGRA